MTTPQTLIDLLSRLRVQENEAEEELHNVRENIKAVERTMVLLGQQSEHQSSEEPPTPPRYRAEDFAGMSQAEAIISLANRDNGIVKVKEAKRMLLETGLTKSKKAYQIATGTIIRSGRFEWAASGVYRLKAPANGRGHEQEQPALIQAR